MLKFYYHPAPNPAKVALFLEESGLPYEVVPVDTRKGEQFAPEYLAINPNAKTPALVDGDAVEILGPDDQLLAKGLVRTSAENFPDADDVVVHRDDLVLLRRP